MDRRIKVIIFVGISMLLALLGHSYREKKVEIDKKPWGYVGMAKDSKGNQGILEVYIENGKIVKAEYDEICYPKSEQFSGQKKKGNTVYNLKMKEKSGISFDDAVEALVENYKSEKDIDIVAGATGSSEIFKRISKKLNSEIK